MKKDPDLHSHSSTNPLHPLLTTHLDFHSSPLTLLHFHQSHSPVTLNPPHISNATPLHYSPLPSSLPLPLLPPPPLLLLSTPSLLPLLCSTSPIPHTRPPFLSSTSSNPSLLTTLTPQISLLHHIHYSPLHHSHAPTPSHFTAPIPPQPFLTCPIPPQPLLSLTISIPSFPLHHNHSSPLHHTHSTTAISHLSHFTTSTPHSSQLHHAHYTTITPPCSTILLLPIHHFYSTTTLPLLPTSPFLLHHNHFHSTPLHHFHSTTTIPPLPLLPTTTLTPLPLHLHSQCCWSIILFDRIMLIPETVKQEVQRACD